MTSSILHPEPWNVDYIKPKLYAYRREKTSPLIISHDIPPKATAQLLNINDFLSAPRVTFVTHGFRNDITIPWMAKIKDELLKESDQTVILIDWGNGADLVAPRYLQAAANIQSVGKWLSDYLVEIGALKPLLTIWGIAHSLGCHLLGVAGRHSRKFDRISAMDPAGPAFEKHEFLSFRLCSQDAKMVDVMHTDGYDSFLDPEDWISPVNHYGTLIPLGTIDFFPNYGYDQPGAGPVTSHLLAASHLRAIDLYIWSISNPSRFLTNKVLDGEPGFELPVTKVKDAEIEAEMGYYAYRSPAKSGVYYVHTNKTCPWVGDGGKNEVKETEIIIKPAQPASACVVS